MSAKSWALVAGEITCTNGASRGSVRIAVRATPYKGAAMRFSKAVANQLAETAGRLPCGVENCPVLAPSRPPRGPSASPQNGSVGRPGRGA